jgi:hypothetical protein
MKLSAYEAPGQFASSNGKSELHISSVPRSRAIRIDLPACCRPMRPRQTRN